jgi:hypothetical protein
MFSKQQHTHLAPATLLATSCTLSLLGSTTDSKNNHVGTNTDLCVKNITRLSIVHSKVTAMINMVKRLANMYNIKIYETLCRHGLPMLVIKYTSKTAALLFAYYVSKFSKLA